MSYKVKEIFYSLQGEGTWSGCPAVFCRFSGCNLWSGREEDRAKAVCRICDTDFRDTNGENGGFYEKPQSLTKVIHGMLPLDRATNPLVVITGGEPLLQLDEELVNCLHASHFQILVETNGTLLPPHGVDWMCVSPKPGADLRLRAGDELKVVFPQEGLNPADYASLNFRHFFLQPLHNADYHRNLRLAVEYCLRHPTWRLSLQIHKLIGIP